MALHKKVVQGGIPKIEDPGALMDAFLPTMDRTELMELHEKIVRDSVIGDLFRAIIEDLSEEGRRKLLKELTGAKD